MPAKRDITDQRFGRLTALHRDSTDSRRWVCRCDCGKQKSIQLGHITTGRIKSCGCLVVETTSRRLTTHGKGNAKCPEYRTWKNIKNRCLNPKSEKYEFYSKVGICERWRNSFEAFLEDMGEKPSPRHSIERKNNLKGYSKENCIWALPSRQVRNRRVSRMITFMGETRHLYDFAEEYGLDGPIVAQRLAKGWDVERALTMPRRAW